HRRHLRWRRRPGEATRGERSGAEVRGNVVVPIRLRARRNERRRLYARGRERQVRGGEVRPQSVARLPHGNGRIPLSKSDPRRRCSMSSRQIGRRTLLRGAGGIAIGLPFLDIMARSERARAGAPTIPQRFVVFFSPNGTIRERWKPTGNETDF